MNNIKLLKWKVIEMEQIEPDLQQGNHLCNNEGENIFNSKQDEHEDDIAYSENHKSQQCAKSLKTHIKGLWGDTKVNSKTRSGRI